MHRHWFKKHPAGLLWWLASTTAPFRFPGADPKVPEIWRFPKMVVPQNGWFIMGNPCTVPLRKPPYDSEYNQSSPQRTINHQRSTNNHYLKATPPSAWLVPASSWVNLSYLPASTETNLLRPKSLQQTSNSQLPNRLMMPQLTKSHVHIEIRQPLRCAFPAQILELQKGEFWMHLSGCVFRLTFSGRKIRHLSLSHRLSPSVAAAFSGLPYLCKVRLHDPPSILWDQLC